MKKFIREKLHPALWRLTLRSNAIECQRRPKMRPIITGAALDELFKKCPNIQTITLDNVDLSQVCMTQDYILLSNSIVCMCPRFIVFTILTLLA